MKEYDPHQSCKEALLRAYDHKAEAVRIKEVLQIDKFGNYHILKIQRVDAFEDGLRVVVL